MSRGQRGCCIRHRGRRERSEGKAGRRLGRADGKAVLLERTFSICYGAPESLVYHTVAGLVHGPRVCQGNRSTRARQGTHDGWLASNDRSLSSTVAILPERSQAVPWSETKLRICRRKERTAHLDEIGHFLAQGSPGSLSLVVRGVNGYLEKRGGLDVALECGSMVASTLQILRLENLVAGHTEERCCRSLGRLSQHCLLCFVLDVCD